MEWNEMKWALSGKWGVKKVCKEPGIYLPLVQNNACYPTGWVGKNKMIIALAYRALRTSSCTLCTYSQVQQVICSKSESSWVCQFNIWDLRGEDGLNVSVQMASLKVGSLTEFLALKLKMPSIICVYDNSLPELRNCSFYSSIGNM